MKIRSGTGWGALGLLFFIYSQTSQAHPHSFITLQTTPLIRHGQLTGFDMRWTMDELTSADLLYDAGKASPDAAVWKTLAAGVMANVMGQHYFSELIIGGKRVPFMPHPTAYALARDHHQAVLTFTLPLAIPQDLAGRTAELITFDPTYYVDMHYRHERDIRLPDTLSGCQVQIKNPAPSEALRQFARSLDSGDTPNDDQELGRQFAQKVVLICPQ